MDKKTYDYVARITSIKEKSRITVRFSDDSILLNLLREAKGEVIFEEDAKEICDNIEGQGWNRRLRRRFKNYMRSGRIPYEFFLNICTYLKKDPNDVLNQGKCALTDAYNTWVIFDPHRIMQVSKLLGSK